MRENVLTVSLSDILQNVFNGSVTQLLKNSILLGLYRPNNPSRIILNQAVYCTVSLLLSTAASGLSGLRQTS